MTLSPESHPKSRPPAPETISEYDRKLIERYAVSLADVNSIQPSPENVEVYGPTTEAADKALPMLIRSIERIGLEEPLILTRDNFILSGHRRFFAVKRLGWDRVPVRFADVTREDSTDYHRLLAQYNPQRVKSVASVLSERLLECEDTDGHSWTEYHQERTKIKVKPMRVAGCKSIAEIGERQQEFLQAAVKVIEKMRPYWPLSIRQIHYKLLNNPPLTQTTKKAGKRWRYRNNLACYSKLSTLLVAARYHGHVPWQAIDDSTRSTTTYDGQYEDLGEYMDFQVEGFLSGCGYGRNHQEGQPNHVEVLIEKNTLSNVLGGICSQLHVPYTPLRGFGGPSVWREIEERWNDAVDNHTGPVAPKCILVIVSDHDPEGLSLADDAVRSLRDNHGVEVEAIRPAVTLQQVKQYSLSPNPAKESSTRFAEYVKRTGTNQCWECEALEPEVLRKILHETLLKVMDVDQLNAVQELEAEEKNQLGAIKRRLGTRLQDIIEEEGL
jgi:hypothetical protein